MSNNSEQSTTGQLLSFDTEELVVTPEAHLLILQAASSMFLTEEYPDDWEELDEEQQTDFINDHCWQPFEYKEADEVRQLIDNAYTTITFLINKLSCLRIKNQDNALTPGTKELKQKKS